jgi:hypothetical protein
VQRGVRLWIGLAAAEPLPEDVVGPALI